jgi:hypothetical protein
MVVQGQQWQPDKYLSQLKPKQIPKEIDITYSELTTGFISVLDLADCGLDVKLVLKRSVLKSCITNKLYNKQMFLRRVICLFLSLSNTSLQPVP